MKILFALHGYPPELMGGTESTVRAQARGLVARGHEVVVVAGSMDWEDGFRITHDTDVDPESGRSYPIHRIHRDDLYFDHWQKSASPKVGRAFADILREERPDVLHVQHWIRLSRDLIAIAAREGIPAIVSLHDLWTTCLLTFRVQPESAALCEEQAGISPCLNCAGAVPPKTSWVTFEAGAIAFAEREAEVSRELDLARAIVTPSRAHAESIERFLRREPGALHAHVLPPGRELETEAELNCPARARDAAVLPDVAETGKLVLGAWGHLNPIKGLDLVLEAIAELEHPTGVELHIAGGEVHPAHAARLHEMADRLDVHFYGPYEVNQLSQLPVTQVHAMISGSRAHESWGLVLDEAWHLALPAILPNRGAFGERLSGERGGLLYEAGNAQDLARVLRRLLDEPELLPQLRASIPAADEITPTAAQSISMLESLYLEAIEAGPPKAPAYESLQELVRARALQEWDNSLSRRTPAQLGFGEAAH